MLGSPDQDGNGSDDGFDHLDLAWLRAKPGVKWAEAARAGDDVLPCWVADMDFPAPAPVREALSRLAQGADLGYPPHHEAALLEESWALRMASRYAWSPGPGRFRVFTDVVQAVQAVISVSTQPGDGVVLFTPSYPPFVRTIQEMGRRLVAVPAVDHGRDAGWSWDLAAAEAGAASARVVLLVNPHNPTGRMLTRSELMAVGELAEHHDMVVIADEVHADLALAGLSHIPLASLSPALEARTVTLYSASKSHNLGGMCCAVAHVGHEGVERGLAAMPFHLLGRAGVAAVAATLASWTTEGDAWLERCLTRLRANRDKLGAWLTGAGAGAGAGARGHPPEGTYLAWLDFRDTDLGDDPAQWLLAHARVMLTSGSSFGPGGEGFGRLNFATTPGLLDEILGRLATSLGVAAALAGDRHAPGHQRIP